MGMGMIIVIPIPLFWILFLIREFFIYFLESFTDESFGIVTQLIDDVFNICPLAPAIHLGGDEVWHLGSGMRSQDRMERGETKGDLYLKHYSFVIDYILRKYPGNY